MVFTHPFSQNRGGIADKSVGSGVGWVLFEPIVPVERTIYDEKAFVHLLYAVFSNFTIGMCVNRQ